MDGNFVFFLSSRIILELYIIMNEMALNCIVQEEMKVIHL